MPCYDARDTWSADHGHQAAHLLCEICKTLEPGDQRWTAALAQWWADHQDMDAYYARRSNERR